MTCRITRSVAGWFSLGVFVGGLAHSDLAQAQVQVGVEVPDCDAALASQLEHRVALELNHATPRTGPVPAEPVGRVVVSLDDCELAGGGVRIARPEVPGVSVRSHPVEALGARTDRDGRLRTLVLLIVEVLRHTQPPESAGASASAAETPAPEPVGASVSAVETRAPEPDPDLRAAPGPEPVVDSGAPVVAGRRLTRPSYAHVMRMADNFVAPATILGTLWFWGCDGGTGPPSTDGKVQLCNAMPVVSGLGFGAYLTTGPIIHLVHDNHAGAAWSLALRGAGVGTAIGLMLAGGGSDSQSGRWGLAGAAMALVVPGVIDRMWLSQARWRDVPAEAGLQLTAAPVLAPGVVGASVSGRFL